MKISPAIIIMTIEGNASSYRHKQYININIKTMNLMGEFTNELIEHNIIIINNQKANGT